MRFPMSLSRFVLTIFFVQGVTFLPAVSQSPVSKEEVIKKIQEKYSSIENVSADFTQATKYRFSSAEQIQSGSVKIGKNNAFKIILSHQEIVSNGTTVWVYSESTHQVLVNTFNQTNSALSPEKLLRGMPDDFKVTTMEQDSGTVSLSMVPTHAKGNTIPITEMNISVTQNDWVIHRIEYTDKNGTSVVMTFTHIRFNEHFGEKEFEFTPEPSMRVLDLRKVQ